MFKIDGTFYLIFSKQDGWTPTDNFYMTATSMAGPWSEATLLAPEGSYAYLTQNAYDIVIQGSEQTTYLYYGDHWSGNFLGSSTYSFHPAVVEEGGKLSLHNTGAWTLDLTTGVWSDLPYVHISAADSTTPKENLVECEDGCEGGSGANMTDSSSFSFTFSGDGGAGSSKILGVEYVYNGPKNKFLHASVSVNGVEGEGMVLMETSRGTTFAQEAPFPVGSLGQGDEVEIRLVDWDGNVVLVEGVRVYEDLR